MALKKKTCSSGRQRKHIKHRVQQVGLTFSPGSTTRSRGRGPPGSRCTWRSGGTSPPQPLSPDQTAKEEMTRQLFIFSLSPSLKGAGLFAILVLVRSIVGHYIKWAIHTELQQTSFRKVFNFHRAIVESMVSPSDEGSSTEP